MRRHSRVGLALALLCTAFATSSSQAAGKAKEPLVGTLHSADVAAWRAKGFPQLCECEFYPGSAVTMSTNVLSTGNGRRHALARIGGKLTTLGIDKDTEGMCTPGRKVQQRWKAQSSVAVLSLTVDSSGQESCWFRGTLSVTTGAETEVVKINGACGC